MRIPRSAYVAAVCAVMFVPRLAWSQGNGAIAGVVRDSSGSVPTFWYGDQYGYIVRVQPFE